MLDLSIRLAVLDDIRACAVLRGQTRENAISIEQLATMGITVESWADDVRSGSLTGYVCRHLGWASTGTFDPRGDEILELFPSSVR